VLKRLALLPILLLAAFLRFHRLDAQSFWNDEGNSARLAERTPDLIIAGAAGDIHPPGYYLLLAVWRAAAGQSEFALRALSALAGVLVVVVVYRLGLRWFDPNAALASAALAAVSPPLIYYSQEARMYELAGLWAAAVFLAAGWPDGPRRRAALAAVLAAGLYTHYAFGFVVVALNLLVLLRLAGPALTARAWPAWRALALEWILPQAAALLVFAPWLPIALRQVTSWPAGRTYLPAGQAALGVAHWLAVGPTLDAAIDPALAGGLAVLVGLSIWRRPRLEPWVWLAVPVAATLGLGLFSAPFAKFLIVAVPALCLLGGNGLAAIRRAGGAPPEPDLVRRTAGFMQPFIVLPILLPTLALPLAVSLNNLYNNPTYQRADYRGIARYLDAAARPGDAILLNAPNQWEVFTYYHRDLSNVFPVARARPLDAAAQTAELERIAASHARLFVLYWGDAQSDPGRVIESWLNTHTFKAYDQWYSDVRLAAYAAPRTSAAAQSALKVDFGGLITLTGYSLNAQTFAPGDILQLTLFWRLSGAPLAARYKVFVHVASPAGGPPAAQHDGEPGGGLSLTNTWRPGETVADNHGVFLPRDLPAGDYRLEVGLYGVDDGARLTQPGGDALTLASLHIQ
jgi:mannosyltransferase